jgi:hypothetical protein
MVEETDRGHGGLRQIENWAGVPLRSKATPAWLRSSPPEWFLGLADNLAPRQADIVQVPVGPMGQFVALLPAVSPNMELTAQPGQNAKFMIICHRLG